MDEYGENKNERIRNFLLKNPDTIFYFCSDDLYQKLNQIEIRNQLCPLKKGMVEVNPFKNRKIRFETIGIVKIQDQKMIVKRKEEILVKIFNSKGVQKYTDEVKPRDILLIRGEKKDDKYSYNLYLIANKHSRNQAINIIWTDLKIGEKTNKYIDRLPYQYKKMIQDNVE